MPSVPDEFVPIRAGRPVTPAPAPEPAGVLETAQAAGTLSSWPYRSWRYLQNRADVETDPEHDALAAIRGTKYESDPERFAYSRNARETAAIMREWDQDEEAEAAMARAGWGGTVAAVGMGMLDPTVFLPVVPVLAGAARGANALRIGADVALTAGATAAVGEAAMMVTTPGMEAQEAVRNVGTATLLGGLLGAGAGALMSRAERQALTAQLQADRVELGADLSDAMPSGGAATSAGAAASDTRQLELRGVPGLGKVPDPTAQIAPTRRVLQSPLVSARRAMADLAETPYIFEENTQGIATTQGPALDRQIRIEVDRGRVALNKELHRLYRDYRIAQGASTSLAARAKDAVIGKEFNAFKSEVDRALRNGDRHEIPQVAAAAKYFRETIIQPLTAEAQRLKMLPEDLDPKTADSYMMRVWDRAKIVALRGDFTRIVAGHLGEQEAKKIVLQDRLRDELAALSRVEAELARLVKAAPDDAFAASEIARLESRQIALKTNLEDIVLAWEGKSAKEAQAALRQVNRADEARVSAQAAGLAGGGGQALRAADPVVMAAIDAMLATNRITDPQELQKLAGEIADRILGTPDGRLPYDAATGGPAGAGGSEARGPLAARVFMIPDELVRNFLVQDVEEVGAMFLRTMAADVRLTERFGDVNMTEAMKRITEEAAEKASAAKTPAEARRIDDAKNNAIADLAAVRDRIRGTYGLTSDPRGRFFGRMASTAQRVNVLSMLGGVALSSLPDLAGVQWRHGFASAFRHAWIPYAKFLLSPQTRKAVLAYKDQLQTMGIAADTYLATRQSSLYDIMEPYQPQSRFERAVKVAADKFQLFNVLSYWTDFAKLAGGMVSSAETMKAVRALARGTPTPLQIRNLAEGGIDRMMAERIARQLERPGGFDVVNGTEIPNTGVWDDIGARNAFEGIVGRDADIMVITPGQEKALMFNHPVGGLVLQFKSFVAAAHERMLIRSLQARDRNVLQGLVSAIALGVTAEAIYSWLNGRDMPRDPANLIKAGLERSGVLGWYQEFNSAMAKVSSGRADAFRLIGAERPDSRFISRGNFGAFLGPTVGKIEDLMRVTGSVSQGNWTARDTRRIRKLLPAQNLFYIRGLLDKLEDGVNAAAGVAPLENPN